MKKVYLTKAHSVGENKAAQVIHAGEHHVADATAEKLRGKKGVSFPDEKPSQATPASSPQS
jgi:hypothetical protein